MTTTNTPTNGNTSMNVHDMLLDKLAEIDSGGYPYNVHLNMLMTPELKCPDYIRAQFPEHVMLSLSSTLQHNMSWSYDTKMLSFTVTFNGVGAYIEVPSKNILNIISPHDNAAVGFGFLEQQTPQTQTPQTQTQTQTQTPQTQTPQTQTPQTQTPQTQTQTPKNRGKLRLVVDNTTRVQPAC